MMSSSQPDQFHHGQLQSLNSDRVQDQSTASVPSRETPIPWKEELTSVGRLLANCCRNTTTCENFFKPSFARKSLYINGLTAIIRFERTRNEPKRDELGIPRGASKVTTFLRYICTELC